jgi:anti-sigma regulatory factor (Ser/Thr protein kinase)
MGAFTAHFDVPLGKDAPRLARKASVAILAAWDYTDQAWCDSAALVISELVTNAVQHGGGSVVLDLEAHGKQVTLSVADGSSVIPRRREPDGRGGRGLMLVEALTVRWRVEDFRGGKRVRAELLPYPDQR